MWPLYTRTLSRAEVLRTVVFPRVAEWAADRGVQFYNADRASYDRSVPAAFHELDRSSIVLSFLVESLENLERNLIDDDDITKLKNYPEFD